MCHSLLSHYTSALGGMVVWGSDMWYNVPRVSLEWWWFFREVISFVKPDMQNSFWALLDVPSICLGVPMYLGACCIAWPGVLFKLSFFMSFDEVLNVFCWLRWADWVCSHSCLMFSNWGGPALQWVLQGHMLMIFSLRSGISARLRWAASKKPRLGNLWILLS